MLADSLNTLLIWLQNNPVLALLFVFLVAFSESLLIVGMLLPGAALMLAFGAFIALGALQAWPVLIAAILGAIAGDSLSYWLGSYYQQALKTRWPFSAYPALFIRGENFFHRHGGKSIMLGRFVGPLRAVVPAIAGMLGMPRSRFLLANVASACLWAPMYLLPGYLFGLSVDIASEFAGRFLLLLAVVVGVIWFIVFILRQLFLWLVPYNDRLSYRLLLWSQRHPLVGEIPAAIINPDHREVRGLSLLALLLVLSSGLFVFLVETMQLPLFSNTSLLIQNTLLELHNPPSNRVMSILVRLAEPKPALLLATITLIWLMLNDRSEHKLIIRHLLAVPGLPLLLMLLPEAATQALSPAIILTLSLYGFLLLALVRDVSPRWRRHVYAGGISLIMLIMFARLYLGQVLLLQLFVELSLTSLWISALGIAYRRHTLQYKPDRHRHKLLFTLLLVLVIYPFISGPATDTIAAHRQTEILMDKSRWLTSGWQSLDPYRHDLRDRYRFPMNLQWADSLASIQQQLQARGWQLPNREPAQYFNLFKTDAPVTQLPVLPHVHEGRYEALAMVKYSETENRILIIRLWPSAIHLTAPANKNTPLWFGSLSWLEPTTRFGMHYLRSGAGFNLLPQLATLKKHYRIVIRYRKQKTIDWDGSVVLLFRE